MKTTQILKILENKEYGIQAHVALIETGYSVSLKDVDANEFASIVKIFKSEQAATEYAATLVA
jgi:hypothetical protein